MALITVGPYTTTPPPYDLQPGDDFLLREGTVITYSGMEYVVDGTHSDHRITINGSIFTTLGIHLGDSALDSGNVLIVGAGGMIAAENAAVSCSPGESTIINNGLLRGSFGIAVIGDLKLTNSGVIIGEHQGVTGFGSHQLNLVNTGSITCLLSSPGNNVNLAVFGGDLFDRITNKGRLFGNVDLAGGSDIYEGSGGRTVGWVWGNAGDDQLRGGANYDLFFGGLGDDWLTGRGGRDLLFGDDQNTLPSEAGADTFDYNAITDSGPSATARDWIYDFNNGDDRIDLSDIDANTGIAGDQAFIFLPKGTGSSAVGTGQIGWFQVDSMGTGNDRTIIRINNDADGAIEMQIELQGLITLSAVAGVDFIF